jgi:hypothetical protein
MKKLILILLFPLTLFSQKQERISTAYAEINTGVAFIDEFPFPGMSGLIGTTLNAGGFLIDLEAGVALPTLWTAKMGVGYEMGRSQVTAGLRPFPAHVYIQHVITGKKYGAFLISVELGLEEMGVDTDSFESLAMITFGWRFTLNDFKLGK